MDNKELVTCLKTIQSSFNFDVIDYTVRLYNGKVQQNYKTQLQFIENFNQQVINNISSIVNLIKCRLQNSIIGLKYQENNNDNQIFNCHEEEQQSYKELNINDTNANNNQTLQQQTNEIEEEYNEETNKCLENAKQSSYKTLDREEVQKRIYEQFKLAYDPAIRNKEQITYLLAEQTGWSVSTILNIIKKFEYKKINQNSNKHLQTILSSSLQNPLAQPYKLNQIFKRKNKPPLFVSTDCENNNAYNDQQAKCPTKQNNISNLSGYGKKKIKSEQNENKELPNEESFGDTIKQRPNKKKIN